MKIDNAIVHYYPLSPYIPKIQINLREGAKIKLSVVLKDHAAAAGYLARCFPGVPVKLIDHYS